MPAYTAPTFPRYCAIGLSAARPRPSHTSPAPFSDPRAPRRRRYV